MPTDAPTTMLSEDNLSKIAPSIDRGHYDRNKLSPSIVHLGVGGFHRSHLALYVEELCRSGHTEWAIVGAGILPQDRAMGEALTAQDYLYTLVTRDQSGSDVQIVRSIIGYLFGAANPASVVETIADPACQIVSLTVTEGGYPIDDATSLYDPTSAAAGPSSAFGLLALGLAQRQANGLDGLTVLSCDNVLHNGKAANHSTIGEARQIGDGLADWVKDNVTFPNSMVDRITPATTEQNRLDLAAEYGIGDRCPVFTEPFRQWVIEDNFATGRLPLEQLDVIITTDVSPYEEMKLRLLNAGHSCLAYLAALLGIETVHEAMQVPAIREFLAALLHQEAKPTIPAPTGVDLDTYIESLVDRFSNPAIHDQISRLCLDGTAKFPKFLLPTIQSQLKAGGPIRLSTLALAGWCEYLNGVDELGRQISHSSDPKLDQAIKAASAAQQDPARFLDFGDVFGPELGNSERLRDTFAEAIIQLRGNGVRSTIDTHLRES